jgi:hypothetical protein
MGPSKQVSRRTNKKDLGKQLNDVAKDGLDSHNQQVLWEACSRRDPGRKYSTDCNTVRFGLCDDNKGECDDRKGGVDMDGFASKIGKDSVALVPIWREFRIRGHN